MYCFHKSKYTFFDLVVLLLLLPALPLQPRHMQFIAARGCCMYHVTLDFRRSWFAFAPQKPLPPFPTTPL